MGLSIVNSPLAVTYPHRLYTVISYNPKPQFVSVIFYGVPKLRFDF